MSRNVGYAGAKEEDGATCAKAAYRADDPSLSSHCLPVVLHLRVGSSEISPLHVRITSGAVIMQVLFRQSYC